MASKPESISGARQALSAVKRRTAKRAAARARRRAERLAPETAAARYVRGYAD